MEKHYYLVATPESLIASHLTPSDFGNYMAVGTKKNLRSQSVFFEIDPTKTDLPETYVDEKLVPYENGEPKRSVYLSIYRVFEKVPLEALTNLYLVTDDGKVLELTKSQYAQTEKKGIHLYQQYNPFSTMVASKLNPPEFIGFLTDTSKPVSVPKLFFIELQLNDLANDPTLPIKNLPYRNPAHLRECLIKLHHSEERLTKTVLRVRHSELPYRTIESGFFIGDKDNYLYYPFPTQQELETTHFSWWRSALVQHF
ncbi:hypothetical protein SLH46_08660 [Draconibacterium sp. IB214405]|uniref:hypothetical protein n=1 Tax=Draconibacterium sp. IB214405 TaxID=3097352 RepID=UPI002A17E905|nr:hypothetical protein [Draconibacterium sp. IB214405]MDX8339248.1 hypothetical protein [Draconibacterium sp. IB214405]